MLNSQLEDVIRNFLNELSLHPVAVSAQAVDKSIHTGSRFIIERIHEFSGGHSPVWQLHILDREFAAHGAFVFLTILSQYCDTVSMALECFISVFRMKRVGMKKARRPESPGRTWR